MDLDSYPTLADMPGLSPVCWSMQPERAPVAVVMHGYFEYAGYSSMHELIRHTVRQGSIVIYPRWQTDVATPCPGPYDIEPCMQSAASGIRASVH